MGLVGICHQNNAFILRATILNINKDQILYRKYLRLDGNRSSENRSKFFVKPPSSYFNTKYSLQCLYD